MKKVRVNVSSAARLTSSNHARRLELLELSTGLFAQHDQEHA
jgi:hypothetical protein